MLQHKLVVLANGAFGGSIRPCFNYTLVILLVDNPKRQEVNFRLETNCMSKEAIQNHPVAIKDMKNYNCHVV